MKRIFGEKNYDGIWISFFRTQEGIEIGIAEGELRLYDEWRREYTVLVRSWDVYQIRDSKLNTKRSLAVAQGIIDFLGTDYDLPFTAEEIGKIGKHYIRQAQEVITRRNKQIRDLRKTLTAKK